MNNYLAIFIAIACNVCAQCMMKYSSSSGATQTLDMLLSIKTFFALALYGLSFVCMLIVLRTNELSIVSPVMGGIGFAAICILSVFLFQESLTVNKIIGIALITAGIYFINKIS